MQNSYEEQTAQLQEQLSKQEAAQGRRRGGAQSAAASSSSDSSAILLGNREDEEDALQTLKMTQSKIGNHKKEFETLFFAFQSARVFFR